MANYINNVSIKETKFGLKISAPLDKLIEELKQNVSESGWINLEINKRKEPSKKGATHYMKVDDYKPVPKTDKQSDNGFISDNEDLPFPKS